MPSGWDVYYVVFLSALLALAIPAILWLISRSLFRENKRVAPAAVEQRTSQALELTRTVLGQRMNARFFLAANAAVVLITLILALIPCAATFQSDRTPDELLLGLASIVTIAGFAALGLFYSSKKGDLAWLKTFHKKGDR